MKNPSVCARAACALVALIGILVLPNFAQAHDDKNDDHAHHHHKVDVHGVVIAADGTPIAGAYVTLSSPALSKSGHSDARGRFKLDDLAAGTYALYASAHGYQSISERTVSIAEDNKTLTVVLSPSTINSLTVIGEVRAASGATVSTASAPSVTLDAQRAAAAAVRFRSPR